MKSEDSVKVMVQLINTIICGNLAKRRLIHYSEPFARLPGTMPGLGGLTMAHEMRRSDREISSEEALGILRKAEYGVMSTASQDRFPYGVPLNFCVIDNHIYFHSAAEGRKIDNIIDNPRVSFCVVGETCLLPAQFGTKYESAIVFGTASEVFGQEKQKALEGLLAKYSRNHYYEGLKYIQAHFERTRVFKISIETITGKSRK